MPDQVNPSSAGPPAGTLTPAVNGTGVILHTGLGRAVLSVAARQAVADAIEGYCTLEIDARTGKRGSRHDLVSGLLCALTGAESAIVVNNNAAAVMLILHALARDREVIISRGQLVEIGGSFRMPDVMAAGGARLVGVGATNHTEPDDYRAAITDRTALIMAVHRSNFDLAGLDVSVSLDELATLGRERDIPVVYDQGSGALIDLAAYGRHGLDSGYTVREALDQGVDVVCFSGDKLLGGPQAGIIAGRRELLDRMKKDPLMRAFRADKMVYAALQATLALFTDPGRLADGHAVTGMIAATAGELESRAHRLAEGLADRFAHRVYVTVEESSAEIGGGALPVQQLPSRVVALRPEGWTNRQLAAAFRRQSPPVFGRLSGDRFLLDLRTLEERAFPVVEATAGEIADLMDEDASPSESASRSEDASRSKD
ncbi:MAG: L-seryl-tRNA(Sec) selenium transferase [Gemmatimonadetes bacterium]|nr:L-seryl-tRNA(Sec) selenium transferase [Gemmatimonadota bacterium]MYG85591.1 L-seryl-tRNA(Sec) selenium transferase [Gemmatimonadota bacterium]MYJ90788.1 L-seryl-tRNA(Sec) selenium transferase [Gemmatimonadota bacterium]